MEIYFAGGILYKGTHLAYFYDADNDKVTHTNFGYADLTQIGGMVASYGCKNVNPDGTGCGFDLKNKALWEDISTTIIVTEEKHGDNKLYGWVDKYNGELCVGNANNVCRYNVLNYSIVEKKYLRKKKGAKVATRVSKQYKDTESKMPFDYFQPMLESRGFERVFFAQNVMSNDIFNDLYTTEVYISKDGAAYLDVSYSANNCERMGFASGHLTYHCKVDSSYRRNTYNLGVQVNINNDDGVMHCVSDIRDNCFSGYDEAVKHGILLKKPVIDKTDYEFYDNRLFNILCEAYVSEVSKKFFKTDSLNFYVWACILVFQKYYNRFSPSGKKFFKPMYDSLGDRARYLTKHYPLGDKEMKWLRQRIDNLFGR